jgi:hypothetical protein
MAIAVAGRGDGPHKAVLPESIIERTASDKGTPLFENGIDDDAAEFLVIALRPGITPEKEHGGFAEGPFEMCISHLVVCSGDALAGGLVRAFDQPSTGDEVADSREAAYAANLLEYDKREGRSDVRNRLEQLPIDAEDLLADRVHARSRSLPSRRPSDPQSTCRCGYGCLRAR